MSQSPESLEFIFNFALKLLRGREPLPKAAAAEFWVCPQPLPGSSLQTILC